MSLLSVTHEVAPRSSLAVAALRALAQRFIAWRAQRACRLAMLSLLELDAYRLDDLGISIEAVRDALDARH
ncbi:hypothetical protein [Devosia sp. A16]|uniref:hypothetical protein n=1 Tax=Devosia sp. A16 TaxID=1736675 RepID=UPI0006D7A6F8|nr:hypothetical protein [Devosia sp. A16]